MVQIHLLWVILMHHQGITHLSPSSPRLHLNEYRPKWLDVGADWDDSGAYGQ